TALVQVAIKGDKHRGPIVFQIYCSKYGSSKVKFEQLVPILMEDGQVVKNFPRFKETTKMSN
uniref:Uncharacterized protein n=1 Tax=Romanomermis culicivorax TaxID=13658 RepID=A0A915IJE6_ROMCU